jgi:hypothetical protein
MENLVPEFKIGLTQEAVAHLNQIRKWTMFFSILGFVCIGLIIVAGLVLVIVMPSLGSENPMGGMPLVLMAIVYIILAVIYFVPMLFLYRFSVHAKSSLANSDANDLAYALKNLNSHFTFFGVLALILLGIYAVVLVVLLLVALLS